MKKATQSAPIFENHAIPDFFSQPCACMGNARRRHHQSGGLPYLGPPRGVFGRSWGGWGLLWAALGCLWELSGGEGRTHTQNAPTCTLKTLCVPCWSSHMYMHSVHRQIYTYTHTYMRTFSCIVILAWRGAARQECTHIHIYV